MRSRSLKALSCVAVLVVALAVDALGANETRKAIYDVEENAVLTIVIDTICCRLALEPGEIFVILRDANCFDCLAFSRFRWGGSLTTQELGDDTLEICADLKKKCSLGAYWALDLRTNIPYVWIDSTALMATMQESDCGPPFIILSRVGFNDERTKAMCYFRAHLACRSDGLYIVYLAKHGGRWIVRSSRQVVTS